MSWMRSGTYLSQFLRDFSPTLRTINGFKLQKSKSGLNTEIKLYLLQRFQCLRVVRENLQELTQFSSRSNLSRFFLNFIGGVLP